MLENKLASIKKELQQAKKDNAALACYVNARRRRTEGRRRPERRQRRRPARRRRRAKARGMSGLE
jgi:hypothetical protein